MNEQATPPTAGRNSLCWEGKDSTPALVPGALIGKGKIPLPNAMGYDRCGEILYQVGRWVSGYGSVWEGATVQNTLQY